MAKKRPKQLTDQLRQAIDECGLSRYEIAKQTGIDESALAKFYNWHRGLSMEAMNALGELLELRITLHLGENQMSKYWLVGASWGGTEHQDKKWIEQGIWMLGWKKGHQPEKAAGMKPEHRIAIKRMKGKGQTGIRIMHLGIIKGVIFETDRVICTVNWVATNLKRDIAESRGCFQSIHGPFDHDEWIQEVFCL